MPIDANRLRKLLENYWTTLVEWVGGARDGAEDVVQSAFIKLASEDPPPENPVAWLFTISKRLAINEQLSQTKRRSRESLVGRSRSCYHMEFSRVAISNVERSSFKQLRRFEITRGETTELYLQNSTTCTLPLLRILSPSNHLSIN